MNNTKRVDMVMPGTMLKKIDKIAGILETSRSEVIRNALRDYLDEKLLMIGVTDE